MAEQTVFQPIVIVVTREKWDAFPLQGDFLSKRDRELVQEIKAAGGIDETVPPGVYHFNRFKFNGEVKLTLERVRD